MPLVGHIVTERIGGLPSHVRRDDLLSAGYTALVHAARGFDPSLGVPFARYAATRVRGAIIDELRGNDWASRSVRLRARRRDEAQEELTASLGRTPTREELAAHMGVRARGVARSTTTCTGRSCSASRASAPRWTPRAWWPTPRRRRTSDLLGQEQMGYLIDAVAELPERLRQVVEGLLPERAADDRDRRRARGERVAGVPDQRRGAVPAQGRAQQPARPRAGRPRRPSHGCAARRREAYFAAVAARSGYRTRLAGGSHAGFDQSLDQSLNSH